jgi:hypothetical protein
MTVSANEPELESASSPDLPLEAQNIVARDPTVGPASRRSIGNSQAFPIRGKSPRGNGSPFLPFSRGFVR